MATILSAPPCVDEGIGYLWEGLKVRLASCCADTYEYNLKKSIDKLTGGAMNWEGPTYWRAGTIRFLRAFEAFDSGTARQNKIWVNQFPTTKNAGIYKVYLREPSQDRWRTSEMEEIPMKLPWARQLRNGNPERSFPRPTFRLDDDTFPQ